MGGIYWFFAFCLLSSSLTVVPFGQVFYACGIFLGLMYILTRRFKCRLNVFGLFLFVCFASSFLSGYFSRHLWLFGGILLFMTPILTSKSIQTFRVRYICTSLYLFPILSLVSLYCYWAGINMMALNSGDVKWNFSALFGHSMWLGAANGLSNIVILWWLLNAGSRSKKLFFILWLLASIFVSVISASRSALAASCVSMFFLLWVVSKNLKSVVKKMTIVFLLVVVLLPFYYQSADRMIAKFQYQIENQETSRNELVGLRLTEFISSPLWGVGVTVHINPDTGDWEVGRMESGSGWLSILSQTGLLGFFVMAVIIFKIIQRIRRSISFHGQFQLLSAIWIYLLLHSCFEGYILTPGYYLCVLFWGILGLLYSYQKIDGKTGNQVQ